MCRVLDQQLCDEVLGLWADGRLAGEGQGVPQHILKGLLPPLTSGVAAPGQHNTTQQHREAKINTMQHSTMQCTTAAKIKAKSKQKHAMQCTTAQTYSTPSAGMGAVKVDRWCVVSRSSTQVYVCACCSVLLTGTACVQETAVWVTQHDAAHHCCSPEGCCAKHELVQEDAKAPPVNRGRVASSINHLHGNSSTQLIRIRD